MCYRTSKWQREVVKDHKFDFVCTEDFKTNDIVTKIRYIILFLIIIKIVLVYVADLWTAGTLLIFDSWSSAVKPSIPLGIAKWIYVGCIFASFLLLIWDWKKARSIIASGDISFAFTNVIAYRFYAIRSYSYYCFFRKINEQKRKVDVFAFFVFFTFKGWKRLIFAEAPRQVINAVTLYTIVQTNITKDWMNLMAYGNNMIERLTMASMAFMLISFVVSASKLAVAFILYLPLLFYIRGNLKEYCCHKINKRIDELVKRESRKRRMNQRMVEQAMAKGNINKLKKKNKMKSIIARSKRQPTLPTFIGDDNNNNPEQSLPPEYIPIYNNHVVNVANIASPEPIRSPPPYDLRFNNRMPPSHSPPPRSNSPHEYAYINSGPSTNFLGAVPTLTYSPSISSNPPSSHPNPPPSPGHIRYQSPPPSPGHIRYQSPPPILPGTHGGAPTQYIIQDERFNNYYNQMGYGM